MERHGHAEGVTNDLRLQQRAGERAGLHCLLLGDSHFERMVTRYAGAELPRGTAVHAVGGDGVEHVLMRLHLTWASSLAAARAASYVVLVGINNLLGGMSETLGRNSNCESLAAADGPVAL